MRGLVVGAALVVGGGAIGEIGRGEGVMRDASDLHEAVATTPRNWSDRPGRIACS